MASLSDFSGVSFEVQTFVFNCDGVDFINFLSKRVLWISYMRNPCLSQDSEGFPLCFFVDAKECSSSLLVSELPDSFYYIPSCVSVNTSPQLSQR